MSDNITHRHHTEAIWKEAWENRKLVHKVARSVARKNSWVDHEELFTAGLEGLCRALETLDKSQNQYRKRWHLANSIKSAVLTELKFLARPIHVPHYARATPTSKVVLDDDIAYCCDDDDEQLIRLSGIVHEAISALTDKQRQAVCAVHGLGGTRYASTPTDAAADLGVSQKVFMVRQSDGLKAIRRFLETNYPGEFSYETVSASRQDD